MQIFCISLCGYDAILCFNWDRESELQKQPSVMLPFALTWTPILSPSKVSSCQNGEYCTVGSIFTMTYSVPCQNVGRALIFFSWPVLNWLLLFMIKGFITNLLYLSILWTLFDLKGLCKSISYVTHCFLNQS